MSTVAFHSTTKIDADGETPDFWVVAAGRTITATGTGAGWRDHDPDEVVDGTGHRLTPGFIDLHVHGGGGYSHEDGAESVARALAAHHPHGTTRAVASLVSNPIEQLSRSLAGIADLTGTNPLLLGSHLEGPFLSVGKRGAHNADHLTDPSEESVGRLLDAARGTLRHITLDPERAGALPAIRRFVTAGVTVAVGHTEAGYEQSLSALHAGATVLTHAFNGMPGLHHRDPGPVGAALVGGAYLEVILDGHHVHPAVVAMLFTLAPHRIVLVTDAMAAAAAPDGQYLLGGLAVEVEDRVARLRATGSLAGSTLTLDAALRHALEAGIPVVPVIEALTLAPARVLGLSDSFGLVRPGFAADLVLFDHAWQVTSVLADGAWLHRA
ncbi:N-acetylglucosamine-6-phosphate deacetylase [Arthrobacter sp. B0490]|uniref:N-acetylglucosamine-6-phosphate deacetylase n=1 Tax=Arthrobacter sp. B0490 TaxID=2058891 RepID=UPI000CE4E705|nr:N-acetylglucosamine-6-phosphate deacetylase [Arthrobacter sp. B0490]